METDEANTLLSLFAQGNITSHHYRTGYNGVLVFYRIKNASIQTREWVPLVMRNSQLPDDPSQRT